jgi:hypothetical protein
MDSLATTLNLQNELNEAVASEDYKTASKLRDKLAAIKVRSIEYHLAFYCNFWPFFCLHGSQKITRFLFCCKFSENENDTIAMDKDIAMCRRHFRHDAGSCR